MKIRLTSNLFDYRLRLLRFIMKVFMFLFCVTLFGFSPNSGFSQDAEILIDRDQNISVEQVFNLIKSQTNYTFIYSNDQINAIPDVKLEKGIIKAGALLVKVLKPMHLTYEFANNTIIVKKEKAAPQIMINGVVTDPSGLPLVGATVVVTNNEPKAGAPVNKDFILRGTATDFDGRFSLQANEGDFIYVSMMGFEFQYKPIIAGVTTYNFSLKEDVNALEEVLVVGYGTTKRKDLTGSVGSVKSEEIVQVKTQTVDQALVGRMTGVHVSAQAGAPGSGAVVHIRGLSQLIGDNQPLYVVDGVPITINPRFADGTGLGVFGDRENPLLAINPADIERVDVLKDASAAAIYGSRAANGVIVITTKRGKRNQAPRFNFSYSTTIQNPLRTFDALNTEQWVNDFLTPAGLIDQVTVGNANTDWQDKITNDNAVWNQYNFNVSGGSSKVNYLLSARVSDQEGLMLGNKFNRYNFTSSLDADVSDKLRVGFNISYNYSDNKQSGLSNLRTGALYRPDLEVYNDDGSFTQSVGTFGFMLNNPVGDDGEVRNVAISQNVLGSVYGEYKIADGLKLRSQLSLNLLNDHSKVFSPSFTLDALFESFYGASGALLGVNRSAGVTSSWANTLNFNKTFANDHSVDAVLGLSWDYSKLDLESQTYDGFPDDYVLTDIRSAQNVHNYESDFNENALNSVFGRINYNYKEKYLATFTARYDGSSKFGPDNKHGFFPSGALAWNVHNESFLKDNGLISQLKLRASLGRTGSDNLPSFTYLAIYRALGNGDSEYDGVNGIVVEGVPNAGIRWEETDQLDLGLEFGLFNGRLNGEIVYFEKKTNDIILLTPIPGQTGASSWNSNVADVSNKGWEIELGGDIIRNENFRWNSSFNISFIDNNVEALHGGATSSFGSTGITEGEPVGYILGYDVVSVAQTPEEITTLNAGAPDGNYYSGLTQPGDYIYRDVNGDGEITNADRISLGDINPAYYGGWNNNLSYKNWDFTFNFNFVQGNEKYWREGAEIAGINRAYENKTTHIYDLWTPENTDAEYARLGSSTHGYSTATSRDVKDGSYIKLRSASIAYNFNQDWLQKVGISNVRFSLTGNNLFTITSYPGIDPESINTQRGGSTIDLISDQGYSYPQARTFTLGVNISL